MLDLQHLRHLAIALKNIRINVYNFDTDMLSTASEIASAVTVDIAIECPTHSSATTQTKLIIQ